MEIRPRMEVVISAAFITIFGIVGVNEATKLNIGTVARMGPGFFPLVLGVTLLILAVAIVVVGFRSDRSEASVALDTGVMGHFYIMASIVAFILIGDHFGFVPAIFALVFLSATAARQNKLVYNLIYAAVCAAAGFLLFGYFLDIPMPALDWSI